MAGETKTAPRMAGRGLRIAAALSELPWTGWILTRVMFKQLGIAALQDVEFKGAEPSPALQPAPYGASDAAVDRATGSNRRSR